MRAYAHGNDQPLMRVDPLREASAEWVVDPTLLAFVVLAVGYGLNVRKFNRPVVRPLQVLSFYVGIIIQILALNPWVDQLASELFFVHMIQHLGIILLGVPLILCGAPFIVVVRGLPLWARRHIYFPLLKMRWLQWIHRTWRIPLVSLGLFNLNFWFWHQPYWYNLALYDDLAHIVEHGCMAITAVYLWGHILDPAPLRSSLPMGLRVAFLASFMALNLVLAAWLTYATEVWYAYDNIPMPLWWSEQWTRLDDQHLGGLIMWVPGSVITFIYMSICFFVWVHREHHSTAALG